MNKRILIVDDDGTNRYMMETLLKGYGYDVTTAENGREALEKARRDPPDLIVSDSLMPVMDGYNLCRVWKAADTLRHRPFALYTATYTDSKDEKFALDLGVDRFIIKPLEPAVLVGMIGELLEDGYRARQVEAKPLEEEMQFFRQYNEILFKKLEQKMQDLETANRMLSISEEGYRQTFLNASDVIYTVDSSLVLRSISPSVERILGYKAQDFVDRPVTEFGRLVLTPESFERAISDVAAILGGQRIASTVYEFIARDGAILYGEVSGSPLKRDGKITGIVSVARDITDRKQALEALEESEKKFRFLTEKMTDMVWTQDMNLRTLYVSPSIEAMLGFTPEERMGQDVLKQLTPESMSFVLDVMAKELALEQQGQADPERKITLELEYYHKDGSTRWLENIISGIRDDRGVLIGVHGVSRDITKRKAAEISLRAAEEKYRSVFDNAQEGIFRATPEGRFIMVNPAMAHILGYDSPEELTTSITDITG